jgi:iron complex outermembrane receptor protein
LRYTRDRDAQPYYNASRYTRFGGTPIGTFVPGNITQNLSNPSLTPNPINAPYDAALTTYLNGPFTLDSAPFLKVVNNRLTGKIGIDYRPTDNMFVYTSYSKGYRSGNFNTGFVYIFLTPENGGYAKPESVDAYEIGFKSEFADRRVRFNLAGFWYDYKNQQFVDVQGISATLENAGASRIKGVEAELAIRPTDFVTLSASATYLDARFRSLSLIGLDLSGNRLISSPEFSGTAAVDIRLPLSNSNELQLHLDGSYRSRQWFSAFNGRTVPDGTSYAPIGEKPYGLVNGRLSLATGDNLTLSLWSKNIFDVRYVSYALDIHTAYGTRYILEGPPRTYGIELGYKF